ncbi:MAG: hypothetical protein JKY86_15445 [Gammaproteobacteria bacterium]|nr:hypothetical protein [Gammaproteobacteria bacterium]
MTTLTELGEMLIEVDKGRELEHRINGFWQIISCPKNVNLCLSGNKYRLKPVPVKTYYRVYRDHHCSPQSLAAQQKFGDPDIWEANQLNQGFVVTHIHDFEIEE